MGLKAAPLSLVGWAVLAIGVIVTAYFAAWFDVSVPTESGDRVVNLGLMSDRQSGLMLGAVLAGVGAIVAFALRGRSFSLRYLLLVLVLPAAWLVWNAAAVWTWFVLHVLP